MAERVPQLEERIAEWRSYVGRQQAIASVDVDELEDHLRSQVADLKEAGLDDDEAFLIAVKRIGDLESLAREFAQEYSERLWKRLVLGADTEGSRSGWTREVWVALSLAIAAAIGIKIPELFGVGFATDNEPHQVFYARNFSLFILPLLAGFFAWKRRLALTGWLWLAAPVVVAILVMNLLPFVPAGHTQTLAIIHLPIVLWMVVGFAYAGGAWRNHEQRMNFVRFTGEWVIYLALIGFGGGILMAFTAFAFESIGFDAEAIVPRWIMPCGFMGAVIIAAWLVEAKQKVIENMAPVLTMIFIPLFTLVLVAFLGTMLFTGSGINVEREVLIGFDLLLIIVVGLLLYSISAREAQAKAGIFDWLTLVLVLAALLANGVALWAILARISELGFSPNRVAALGENLILVVNLAWSAVLYVRFLRGQLAFKVLERWQTAYLPVYLAWAAVVVLAFPLIFRFQ